MTYCLHRALLGVDKAQNYAIMISSLVKTRLKDSKLSDYYCIIYFLINNSPKNGRASINPSWPGLYNRNFSTVYCCYIYDLLVCPFIACNTRLFHNKILRAKQFGFQPTTNKHVTMLCHGYRLLPEAGTCCAIIVPQACAATILLEIALAPQLFLIGCADSCAASIIAILSAIAIQIQSRIIVFQQL